MSRARRLAPGAHVTSFPWVEGPAIPVPTTLRPPTTPDGGAVATPPVTAPTSGVQLSDLERQAFTKGYQEGERAGLEAGSRRAEALRRRLAETLEELSRLREHLLHEIERQAVRLALAVAKRVLRREVTHNRDFAHRLVTAALERLGPPGQIVVRLHPEDLAFGSLQEKALGSEVSVVSDEHVARGGCRIESDHGFVDAGVDAQLDEIEREVVADEGVAVAVEADTAAAVKAAAGAVPTEPPTET